MQKPEVLITEDGSTSLYSPVFKDGYHSTFGAINESKHIFIDAGFNYIFPKKQNVRILELGFGTGLNFLLSLDSVERNNISLKYTGVEAYPIGLETASKLNYLDILNLDYEKLFMQIHSAIESSIFKINAVELDLIIEDIHKLEFGNGTFDLIYFDAFAPKLQSEMWTKELFSKMFNVLDEGGVLVTYSCTGDVKRAMKSAGFKIEKLPGPKGKREFLRAHK